MKYLSKKNYISKILYLTKGHHLSIFFISLLFIVSSIFDIFSLSSIGVYASFIFSDDPNKSFVFFKYLNEDIVYLLKQNNFFILNILIILLFLIKFFFVVLIQNTILKFSFDRQTEIRKKLVDSFILIPYSDFILRDTSEYITAVGEYTGSFGASISNILKLMSETMVFIFVVTFLFFINGSILLYLITLFLIIIIFFRVVFKQKLNIYGELTAEGSREMFQGINEYFYGFKELQILQKFNFFKNNIMTGALKFATNNRKAQIVNVLPRYILEVTIVFFIISLSFFSGDFVNLVPTLSVFMVAAIRLMPSVSVFITAINNLVFAKYSINKIYNEIVIIENLNSENAKLNYNIQQKKLKFKSFEMKNISFAYPQTDVEIVKNLNFNFNKGDFIGIVGSSGAGKTTLIDLILLLLKPSKGEIFINNELINDSEINSWRNITAYLPQDVFIINDTILSNVALGEISENIDQSNLKLSLEKAKIYEFVNSLKEKDLTVVGERGIKLSGGQKQRIAIARAFYMLREVFIFDESTNALDVENEKQIIEHMNSIKKEKTIIFITHKPSLLEKCNKIYKIENKNISQIK